MVLDQYLTGWPWFLEGRAVPLDDQHCPPFLVKQVSNILGQDIMGDACKLPPNVVYGKCIQNKQRVTDLK